MAERAVVHIARCSEHGLHGARTECFVCGGPVEQVEMVSAESRETLYCKTVNPRRNTGRALTALAEGRVLDAAELLADAHDDLTRIGREENGGNLLTCGEVDVSETVARIRGGAATYRSPGALIREWHEKFGQRVRDFPNAEADDHQVACRLRMIWEEVTELEKALYARELVPVADALADLIYVIWGIAVSYGIDLDAVLAEVHRSNMTKTYDPARAKYAGKVVVKGEGFEEPQIARVLGLERAA